MHHLLILLLFCPCCLFAKVHCFFTPPPNWQIADPKMLSKRTVIGFIDKKKSGFCPSMNLTMEKIHIPLKDYLRIVQKNCTAKKQLWRHIGKIKTRSGDAEVIEIETKTKFGQARLLQMILMQEGNVYILTAGVLKNEFTKYAPIFEKAFRSLTLTEDLLSAIDDKKKKEALLEAWQKKDHGIESSLFEKLIFKEFAYLGACWQVLMLRHAKESHD